MDILERIQAQYEALSRTQKRIADYLLGHADEVCFLSLKAFAERVRATEVTVVNFTHRIGLEGFLDLKKELQSYLRGRLTPYDKLKRAFYLCDDGAGVQPSECIESEMQILRYTFGRLDEDAMPRAISMLEEAKKVYVVGYDVSAPVAQFMTLRLRYLGMDAEPLEFGNMSHVVLEISRQEPKALFILISFPVHTAYMKALSTVLRQSQRQVIAIVNDAQCEVAQNANLTLCCDTSDLVFYNSITGAISLVNLLCTLYASRHQTGLLAVRDTVQNTVEEMERATLSASDQMAATIFIQR